MDADGHIPTEKLVEAGEIGRKYDQKQAERNEYKPSDAAVEAYRQEMLKINQQHYDTPPRTRKRYERSVWKISGR